MTPNQAARAIPRLNSYAARHGLPLVVAGLVKDGGAVLGVFDSDGSEPMLFDQAAAVFAHLENLAQAAPALTAES